MNKFGELIRSKREDNDMYLRHLAAILDMDTGQLSKIERGERTAKKEIIPLLSANLNIEKENLLTLWLADQIYNLIDSENFALNAIQIVEKEISVATN